MTNYKINRNKPDLTEEQINRHKDFSKVLSTHQKVLKYKDATRPLYKNPGFMGLITLLCIVLLVFVINEKENSGEKDHKDTSAATPKTTKPAQIEQDHSITPDSIRPTEEMEERTEKPLKEKVSFQLPKPSFNRFQVDPTKGAVLYHGSSRILIPPFAFTDANGKVIETLVEVSYRELNDPVAIFLGGIPMHYDSTGTEQLISAGMFEIRGFSGNQPVQLKEAITVEIATPAHKNYNTYYLDEKSGKWSYAGADNKVMRFTIQADEKDFPELKPFKDLMWEFVAKNPEEYNHVFSKTWSQFFLDEKQIPASTHARLKHNASEPRFVVRPVALTSGKELNKQILDAKYNEYYEAQKKKEQNGKLLEELRMKQQAWLMSSEGQAYLKWAQSSDGQKQILSSRIVSVFSVNKFGIWNCDTPARLPQGASVTPTYTDQSGKKLDLQEVCLVDYGVNSLYKYYPGRPLQYNPKSQNILWAALPDGKIALFTQDKFKGLSNKGNVSFVMTVIDIHGKSEADIKNLLGMKQHVTAKQLEKDQTSSGTYERRIVMKKEVREELFYENKAIGGVDRRMQTTTSVDSKKKAEALKNKLPLGKK